MPHRPSLKRPEKAGLSLFPYYFDVSLQKKVFHPLTGFRVFFHKPQNLFKSPYFTLSAVPPFKMYLPVAADNSRVLASEA